MRHFLTLKDFTKEEILEIIDLGLAIKKDLKAGVYKEQLKNKTLAMIFEKSSTRTRVSFETGMFQLGGHALFLSNRDIHLGRGEPIKDTARVISGMCDMVMIRTFEHSMIEEFASFSKVPVINGLTDSYHPVQLLADYMTMVEYGVAEGAKVAYVGDGNNMTHSWLMLAAKMGFELRIATPKGYEVESSVLEDALKLAKESGAKITVSNDPKEAIRGATIVTTDTWASMGQEDEKEQRIKAFEGYIVDDLKMCLAKKGGAKITVSNDPKEAIRGATIVTTDTWASMGQEDEKEQRIKAFEGYIVDDLKMCLAKKGAKFLHCLPAYRGQEVSESVLEGHADIVFSEAENRLHAQKGLMVWLEQQKEK